MGARDATHYDALETRDPAVREAADVARLPRHLEHARSRSPYYREVLKGLDLASVSTRAALARLDHDAPPAARLADLDRFERALDAIAAGRPPQDAPFAGLAVVIALVAATVSSQGVAPFIYFRF